MSAAIRVDEDGVVIDLEDYISDLNRRVLKQSERLRVSKVYDPEKGRAKQAFADECNINNIMERYAKYAVIDHVNRFEGNYGDFTGAPGDYQEAMAMVGKAQDMFLSLPSKIRRQFGNDPGAFLDFASNPENIDELRKMGLAKYPTPPVDNTEPPAEAGGAE